MVAWDFVRVAGWTSVLLNARGSSDNRLTSTPGRAAPGSECLLGMVTIVVRQVSYFEASIGGDTSACTVSGV